MAFTIFAIYTAVAVSFINIITDVLKMMTLILFVLILLRPENSFQKKKKVQNLNKLWSLKLINSIS